MPNFERPAIGDTPRWATDAGASVTEPDESKKDTGHVAATEAPAEEMNWLQRQAYRWIGWFGERILTDTMEDFAVRFEGPIVGLIAKGRAAAAGSDSDGEAGVVGHGGAGDGAGIRGPGLEGLGVDEAGSVGVKGEGRIGVRGVGMGDGEGVIGAAASGSDGTGGQFYGEGSGFAVKGQAQGTGPGVWAYSASGVPLLIGSTTGDPAEEDGGVHYDSATHQFRACVDGVWRTLLHRAHRMMLTGWSKKFTAGEAAFTDTYLPFGNEDGADVFSMRPNRAGRIIGITATAIAEVREDTTIEVCRATVGTGLTVTIVAGETSAVATFGAPVEFGTTTADALRVRASGRANEHNDTTISACVEIEYDV